MLRREFLNAAINGSGVLLSPLLQWFHTSTRLPSIFPVRNIPTGFDVLGLGNQYLRMFPALRNRNALMDSILYSSVASRPSRQTGADGVFEILTRATELDFERGATMRIEGWVYSITELRLCALYGPLATRDLGL